jgi:hypothetical protein
MGMRFFRAGQVICAVAFMVACASAETQPGGGGGGGSLPGGMGGMPGGGGGGAPCECVDPANATSTCVDDVCGFTCDRGFTDCNRIADDGCEVSGLCPILASGLAFPYDVAVQGGVAYVAVAQTFDSAGGYILQISLTDGQTSTLVGSEWAPRSVAVGGGHVYWANSFGPNGPNDGRLRRIPIGGGSAETVAFPVAQPFDVRVVDTQVVWGEQGIVSVAEGGIWHAPLDGSAAAVKAPTDVAIVSAIDPHPSGTYWAAILPNQSQVVQEVDIATGATITLASSLANAIVTDGTNLYFSTAGTIHAVALIGGSTVDVVTGLHNAVDLEIDGTTLYFADTGQSGQQNGAVKKCGLNGLNLQTIAGDLAGPSALTVAGGHVYWVDTVGGTVGHAPK